MRKLFALLLFGLMVLISKNAYAASYAANASPATVEVNLVTRYKSITFPTTTRNLNITNNDSADAVFIDIKSSTNQTDISSCALLAPGETIDLYDFATDGISIILDTIYFGGGNGVASPIMVISSY